MAEAEDVLTDAARHATVYAQSLWRRYRTPQDGEPATLLDDVAARLDLLITAIFGESWPIRIAQPPAHATMLAIFFRHDRKPRQRIAVPATDGFSLWLPRDLDLGDIGQTVSLFRTMAMQQVVRARRGSATAMRDNLRPLEADVYLLLEAHAADFELAELLPGMASGIDQLRQLALKRRPPLQQFPRSRQPLEALYQSLLELPAGQHHDRVPRTDSPEASLAQASALITQLALVPDDCREQHLGPRPLMKDWWTGELRKRSDERTLTEGDEGQVDENDSDEAPRSGRLPRRPQERKPTEDEEREDKSDSVWIMQTEDSHPHAEDPMGMQRPVDRDEDVSADEYGDMLSELSEARLVSTPGRPREVLLSDDPPDARAWQELKAAIADGEGFTYPEWDYRNQCYRDPGATVRLLSCGQGSSEWVEKTLAGYGATRAEIRRRFELLQARRVLHRRQTDGDDIDLEAYVDSYADFRAGLPMADGLYQTSRSSDRHMAIMLLIDISGSTDSWVSADKRIIDVEREALLLVCEALEALGEPYAVQAFSGEGPNAVTVRQVKDFSERYSREVALRISALEPQHYTRGGTAIRHATAGLMQQQAAHRLLLVLSDGKPNDKDDYEGRYGVEDMRQAVIEASLQGIYPFCLTIDRQAAAYLPRIFGTHQYCLLPRPELLSTALLDWMKRLVAMQV